VGVAVAAVAVLVVTGTALVVVLRDGGDDDAATDSTPVTSGEPTTSGPATTTSAAPSTSEAPTTTAPTTSAPPSTEPPGRTSPLALYGTCTGPSCPDVQYAADGLPVAYHPGSKTMTVLEATPRDIALDLPESQGRLLTVGPDGVAYLLVESPDEPYPGRILAVPTGADQAGTAHEVVGPTDGLGLVVVAPNADAIEVSDCCGVGVPDGRYPYVDASGATLPGDPTRATWSWEWPSNSRITVRNEVTGQAFEVPQDQPEREGPRQGDLRPLLDGRVPMVIDDNGTSTVWVLDPEGGTWTSTELGDALFWAIDPVGAVLTRDRSSLAYDLVPLV
jgi:hypothetical protein